ncbi:Hypothetical protein PYTT_1371 [Akkermansia glycaniphila]|uniref:Uncharacterized protein n=1 Tax=Akkermansia glycaniphila TaxID=1679444 RepID=A0A1H6LFX8_9BACT|nr:Hypothetical protein PYTT_1371 [Akkermansia glycaniphila]
MPAAKLAYETTWDNDANASLCIVWHNLLVTYGIMSA